MLPRRLAPLVLTALLLPGCGGSDAGPTGPGGNQNEVTVARVDVSPATKTISYGESLQLSASPYDASGNAVTGQTVSWSSANPDIATVNGSGKLTTVGLGTATITASVKGVDGSGSVTVDYAHFTLAPDQGSAEPFTLIALAAPSGAPSLTPGTTVHGTLGEDSVQLVVSSATVLTLELPDVDPGSYDLSVALDDFSLGEAQLTVEQAAPIGDAGAVVDDLTNGVSESLDSLSSVGDASSENVQAAQAAVTSLQDWFQAASAADQLALARYIASNKAALGVPSASGAHVSGPVRTVARTASTYMNDQESPIDSQLDIMQNQMAFSLANDLGDCVQNGFASLACGKLAAERTLFLRTILAELPNVQRVATDPILPTGGMTARPAADPGADEPLDLSNGEATTFVVTADHRSVNALDMGAPGAAGSLAATVEQFSSVWSSLTSWLASVETALGSSTTLTGTPPELNQESTTATLPLDGSYLTLAGTTNAKVACSMVDAHSNLLLTCTTDEPSDQDFSFELDYDNLAFSGSESVDAVVHTAQDPCAQVGTLTLDGDAVQGELTGDDCLEPDLGVAGAHDTYFLSSAQPLSFRFDMSSPDFTPMLDLRSASGMDLVTDIGNPDLLTRLTLPAGSYEVFVYASDGQTLGGYTLSATSDPNTENGCDRHYYNYFQGSVTHSGTIGTADCVDPFAPQQPPEHWDGYFTWVTAGQTVTATVKLSGPGTLSLFTPGTQAPNNFQYRPNAGYVTLKGTATEDGWFSTYVLAQPFNNVSYTISITTSGAAGAPDAQGVARTVPRSRIPIRRE